ncbi:hypothetical protein ElyMa_000063800 [Elysia marginata]|uniref:Uncharacterized protein n=1 Tax=Elysia marginata TaxID=1093978 RepID=A0AAV4EH33_9GAST|nr:hypothetical protein ElyMa_000063800 [Elysia marginata]
MIAQDLCADRSYYRRLYTDAAHCIANRTLFSEGSNRERYCEETNYYYSSRRRNPPFVVFTRGNKELSKRCKFVENFIFSFFDK